MDKSKQRENKMQEQQEALAVKPEGRGEWRSQAGQQPLRFHYYTYGMTIESEIELPELLPVEPSASADVAIRTADIPESLANATFSGKWVQLSPNQCQLNVQGIARYRIEEGRCILVDPRMLDDGEEGVTARDVRQYLLGMSLGVLLYQRNWLPMHVSALKTPSGVWAFTGHSGAGKSTLGAWLHYTQGWPMISDDVAVIKPEDDDAYLYPGPPRVKLWKDALQSLGIDTEGLVRDLTRHDKYHLMVDEAFHRQPEPLKALVILERSAEGEKASLEPLKGVEAFRTVMGALYRPDVGQEFNSPADLMGRIAKLTDRIDVYRYRRPWSLDDMDSSVENLLDFIKRTVK